MMLHISLSMQETYVLANSKTSRRQRKGWIVSNSWQLGRKNDKVEMPSHPKPRSVPRARSFSQIFGKKRGGWRRMVDQQSLPASPQHETLEGGSTPGMRRINQGRLRQYSASGYFMTCSSIKQNAMFLAMDFGYALAMEVQGTPDGCVPRN